MGLSAGSVTIGLGADYGGLSRDLSKAQRELSRFGKSASHALAPIMMGSNIFGGNQLSGDITRAASAMWGFAEAIKAAGMAMKTIGTVKLAGASRSATDAALKEVRKRFEADREAISSRSMKRQGWQHVRDIQSGRRGLKSIMTDEGIMRQTIEGVKESYGISTAQKPKAATGRAGVPAMRGAGFSAGGIALGATAAGMLAAGGLASVAADRVAKERQLAESLRMTDSSLRSMNLAARKSGVEEQKVAEMLSKVATVSSQAAMGMGEAQKAFQMLGLDAKKIAGMGADEQLYAVTERLRVMSDQTARAGIAAKIFGESAGRSLSFLMGLEAGAKKDSWIQSFGETGRNSLMAMIPSWERFTEKIAVSANNLAGIFAALWRIGEKGMNVLASSFLWLTDIVVKLVDAMARMLEWAKGLVGMGDKNLPTAAEVKSPLVSPVDMFQQKELGSSTIVNRSLIDVSGYAAQTVQGKILNAVERIAENTSKTNTVGTGAVLATR